MDEQKLQVTSGPNRAQFEVGFDRGVEHLTKGYGELRDIFGELYKTRSDCRNSNFHVDQEELEWRANFALRIEQELRRVMTVDPADCLQLGREIEQIRETAKECVTLAGMGREYFAWLKWFVSFESALSAVIEADKKVAALSECACANVDEA